MTVTWSDLPYTKSSKDGTSGFSEPLAITRGVRQRLSTLTACLLTSSGTHCVLTALNTVHEGDGLQNSCLLLSFYTDGMLLLVGKLGSNLASVVQFIIGIDGPSGANGEPSEDLAES